MCEHQNAHHRKIQPFVHDVSSFFKLLRSTNSMVVGQLPLPIFQGRELKLPVLEVFTSDAGQWGKYCIVNAYQRGIYQRSSRFPWHVSVKIPIYRKLLSGQQHVFCSNKICECEWKIPRSSYDVDDCCFITATSVVCCFHHVLRNTMKERRFESI